MREMIPRYRGSGQIEGWRCSNCAWHCDLPHPLFEVDIQLERKLRCEERFLQHICGEFPN